MNTRGLTEIVILNAGLAAGILPAAVFLAYLVMTGVTTALTGPALSILARTTRRRGPGGEARVDRRTRPRRVPARPAIGDGPGGPPLILGASVRRPGPVGHRRRSSDRGDPPG